MAVDSSQRGENRNVRMLILRIDSPQRGKDNSMTGTDDDRFEPLRGEDLGLAGNGWQRITSRTSSSPNDELCDRCRSYVDLQVYAGQANGVAASNRVELPHPFGTSRHEREDLRCGA